LAAHIGYALIQSFVMLFVVMFGLWVTSYSVMDEPIAFGEMFSAFMVYLPASFVFIGLTALLIGLIPKRAAVIMYSYFGLTFTLMYFGPMADLPKEMTYITPFGFVPQIPIDTVNPWAIVSLLLVSAALIAGSFFLYRRRSLRFAA
ncbi:MAG: ABC transporter permease, partial [Firmicutes bacterium]|nr:ABC transporter permease [Bacillota bacterium]